MGGEGRLWLSLKFSEILPALGDYFCGRLIKWLKIELFSVIKSVVSANS